MLLASPTTRSLGCVRRAFVLLALGLPVLSTAGPAEDAQAAYDRGDYAGAFRIWNGLAEQGNAEAQNKVGGMYLDGRGATQNNVTASDWFRRAADQGFAAGQCNLGFAYSQGRGVTKDETEAVRWYRKAAEQNFARCQDNLGTAYRDGRGVVKDEAEAVAWFRKAAEQGNARAQSNLGFMYANGRGIAKNEVEAVLWYRRGAEQGYALAQNNLGVMYRDGRGIAQDDEAAALWFGKAAEQSNALAVKNLAAMNEQGRGASKSGVAAVAASPQTFASAGIGRNTALEVGRVTLRISDGEWENVGAGRGGRPFTGDRSGDIQYETGHLLLRGNAGEFRAALAVRASRGVGLVHFTWNTKCEAGSNVYVVDSAGGNFRGVDCLRVSGPIRTQGFLEASEPEMLSELTAHKVVLPNTAYVVIYEKAIESGAFILVRIVFAADFNLPNAASTQGDLPAGIKPEAIAWGLRLAEAVRSSIHSLSGSLLLPPVGGGL